MKIELGEITRGHMAILGIEEFPFTEAELKTKYRALLKQEHPDSSGKKSGAVIKVIEAYKHLKNLVSENVPTEDVPIEEDSDDLFDLTEQCPKCKGKKAVAERVWTSTPGECMLCNGTGEVPIKCKFCESGKFKTRSGKIVDCRVCKGTGIWKTKKCRCQEEEIHSQLFNFAAAFRLLFGAPGHYELKSIICPKCFGKGKVKLDLFNPVIPKGAILK